MGEVLLFEEMLMSDLSPAFIDELVAEAGYSDFGKARFGVRNFKIRYVTQDRGVKTEATATIGVPVGDDVPRPLPVMVWLHSTTGFMDDCAPSKDPFMGAVGGTLWGAQGYMTVSPDFIGMLGLGDPSPPGTIHSYLVGEATAIASLDSIRALFQTLDQHPELGAANPEQVVLLGGSQGGHATLFTELLWPYYAPEYNVVAAVAAVPPANLLGQARFALTHIVDGSANVLFALTAMKNWYGVPDDLTGLVTNQAPFFLADTMEELMASACSLDWDLSDLTEVSEVYLPSIVEAVESGAWDEIPPWGCFLRENSIPGTSVPRRSDTPILTTFSEMDGLVMTSIERETWPQLCDMGYRLEYLECAGLSHSKGALAALAYARKWLEDRLAGKPWDPSKICTLGEPVDCSTL
jgi:hypothetical protein